MKNKPIIKLGVPVSNTQNNARPRGEKQSRKRASRYQLARVMIQRRANLHHMRTMHADRLMQLIARHTKLPSPNNEYRTTSSD
jgi:hypothetical protein